MLYITGTAHSNCELWLVVCFRLNLQRAHSHASLRINCNNFGDPLIRSLHGVVLQIIAMGLWWLCVNMSNTHVRHNYHRRLCVFEAGSGIMRSMRFIGAHWTHEDLCPSLSVSTKLQRPWELKKKKEKRTKTKHGNIKTCYTFRKQLDQFDNTYTAKSHNPAEVFPGTQYHCKYVLL